VNKVQAINDYTVKLLDLLENKPDTDREEKIQVINELLEKREMEINRLSTPYSAQEMELGTRLVNLNKKLLLLFDREKFLIQKDIKDLHTKKESNQKYVNPYESLSTGGIFYDKQK
jgi:flagellar protein FliT